MGEGKAISVVETGMEVVLATRARIGECPLWDPRDGLLVWVDIDEMSLHRFDPRTGRDERFALPERVGFAALRAAGGYVVGLERGFATLDPHNGRVELVAEVEPDLTTRINDGACDSRGRVWAGTLADDLAPGAGSLYRLDPEGTVRRVLGGITISNGIGWSPDHRTLYYVDSLALRLDSIGFDVETGALGARRPFVTFPWGPGFPPPRGFPDGLAVDEEGFLWVAVFGGWAVHRYGPDGRLDRVLPLPVRYVTSCGFGGESLRDLYITSATHLMKPVDWPRQPQAGALFRCRPGVAGLPAHAFGG